MIVVALNLVALLSTVPLEVPLSTSQATTRPKVQVTLDDGPYLFHGPDGVTARWVAKGKTESRNFASGEPVILPEFAALLGGELSLRQHRPEPHTWPMPEKLLAISDVEGRYATMQKFLRANGVIDAKDQWTFGKGHLVCIGDMVDRGTEVTETLWLLYRLAGEATAAGGHVHFVLGNHEVMMMGGDVRYTAKKYHDVAKVLGVTVEGLLGSDTEFGRWLRTRNAVVKIGDLLFVHAGISPAIVEADIDLGKLNNAIRAAAGVPRSKITDPVAATLAWNSQGPLWYRGYFKDPSIRASFGPRPTAETVDRVLEYFGVKSIVVGHTKVDRVTDVYGQHRVIAIDIPWTNPERVRGLLRLTDNLEVTNIRGERTPLPK